MGGLALKQAYTRRCSRGEFEQYSRELIDTLLVTFQKAEVPLYFRSKETFGDIDILVISKNIDMIKYINETFQPNEIFHNGNVYSFDYKEVQIDLILCSAENFDSNYHYLSWNDLGNFIGRIAQRLGLKFGQEGLWYNHYFKGQKIGKIMISNDYPKIFEFLGFDYDVWTRGFDTLEDVFEYVTTTKYFDSSMFDLSKLNKINRERNAKRKSYMSFLDYIEEFHPDRDFDFEEKSVYVKEANKMFPEARMTEHMRRLEYQECKAKYISSKFGGGVVMSRYGLKGKELGRTLNGFKEWVDTYYIQGEDVDTTLSTDYDDFILNTSTDRIYEVFEEYYKNHLI